ncbi:serine/threonine protein kinase [Pueribacillus sp. YX66]|uniref:serine/threonine protein kinase n=1 Tax=Pueribacillus sp. YX66 TaxID=3229242 RepID=UPI00358D84C5
MMHLTKNPAVNVKPGTLIIGKWNRNRYKIVRQLGYGSIGAVYLVQSSVGLYALKIGYDKMGIISEVNALKRLTSVQGQCLGPFFVEMDDWNGWTFYVMEYINGHSLTSFIQKKGSEWIVVFMLQLLSELEKLHQQGYIFGDLKPENLLVSIPSPRIRWLDVGGVTKIGRSVKEFTSFYDRAYWGAGSRKAEPSYDLFSLTIIFIQLGSPNRLTKKEEGVRQLERKVMISSDLNQYSSILIRALRGTFGSAATMRDALLTKVNGTKQQFVMSRVEHKRLRKQKKRTVFRMMFLMTFLFILFLLYLHFKGI